RARILRDEQGCYHHGVTAEQTPGSAACPRCGQADPGPVACPRCGVVFAKIRSRATAPPAASEGDDGDPTPFPWGGALAIALVAVCAVAGWRSLRAPARPAVGPVAASRPPQAAPPPAVDLPPPPITAAAAPIEPVQVDSAGMADEDRQKAEALARRLPAVVAGDVA